MTCGAASCGCTRHGRSRPLSPKLRDALLLALSGQFAYGEMAMLLNVPAGTVKWRVSEARKQVRARLGARGSVDAR